MTLTYKEQGVLLKKYELKVPFSGFVTKEKEAVSVAEKIGYPLAMKIASSHLHRTEIGGVFTNIRNKKEVRESFLKLKKISHTEGVIIQKMIFGAEFFLGGKNDDIFGPVIIFGTGGVFVELYHDVAFRLAPVTKKDAREMIEEVKGKKLLSGFRGLPKLKKEKLIEVIQKVSLLLSNEDIKEADFNPVILNKTGAFVCDVKIKI